ETADRVSIEVTPALNSVSIQVGDGSTFPAALTLYLVDSMVLAHAGRGLRGNSPTGQVLPTAPPAATWQLVSRRSGGGKMEVGIRWPAGGFTVPATEPCLARASTLAVAPSPSGEGASSRLRPRTFGAPSPPATPPAPAARRAPSSATTHAPERAAP